MTIRPYLLALLLTCVLSGAGDPPPAQEAPPNIVVILADDLGYGDVGRYNPAAKTRTPHLDRLADAGMRFTDAHAPGSLCMPSRYGLMTGRYPYRIAWREWNERALLEPGQPTLATLLKESGYETAMVGKWHLGFEGGLDFDCTKPLRGGPVDHGFDRFFGMHASLDIPPYFYVEDDHCVVAPTEHVGAHNSPDPPWNDIQGAFWREGARAPGFHFEDVLPRFREEAIAVLEDHHRRDSDAPFFLYLALTAPHTPWLPLEAFEGRSEAGLYGDFVAQVDDLVGDVMQALERLGYEDDTLVLFTSDNGPVWYDKDVARFGHDSAGGLRGMKADAWEGGHRMPFIVRWPGAVPSGAVAGAPVAFTDLLATFADVVGRDLPAGAAQDGLSILPVLRGEAEEVAGREAIVHTASGYRAVRQGRWKLIPGLGSGGFSKPRRVEPGPGDPQGQLYDLEADPFERHNVYADHPQVVGRLSRYLD